MTTRAADDFGAIRARMEELKGQKSPSPPPPPKYQGATPIVAGRAHLCSLHNHSGTCGICGKPCNPVPVPSTEDSDEVDYMGRGW